MASRSYGTLTQCAVPVLIDSADERADNYSSAIGRECVPVLSISMTYGQVRALAPGPLIRPRRTSQWLSQLDSNHFGHYCIDNA